MYLCNVKTNKKVAMRTHELERKLKNAGCYFLRHGGRHDHWFSPITNKMFPVPRHGPKEIPDKTVGMIAKESGVEL